MRVRNGLPQVAAGMAACQPLRVIYFGGSITDAPGWRGGVDAWMRANDPPSEIAMINASIGGTGSDLGGFRLPPGYPFSGWGGQSRGHDPISANLLRT